VLFSGEIDFFIQGRHSRFVRIRKGEQLSSAHFNEVCKTPKKMFWDSFSFSGTGPLMPIEGMTRSDKCVGIIERKGITYNMRKAFPESEGYFQETQIGCV